MYSLLLFLHSLFRWLVISSLLYAILRAYRCFRSQRDSRSSDGSQAGKPFTKADDSIRRRDLTNHRFDAQGRLIGYDFYVPITITWK